MSLFIVIVVFFITLSILRVIIGPSIWDRLLGFNLVSAKLLILIVLLASYFQSSLILDIAITYAVLGFIGTVFIATYIQKRGRL
ncbi:MAG: pH regulation protein F [Clostridia bacterium]|nr:pH regulation protein F [Clostridia bacterium]